MNSKYFLFLILIALFSACSSHKTISTKWQEEAIIPISDIPRTAYQYSTDDNLFYLFTNDDEFLYVNLKVDDQNLQKRLLMSGFTIWIDSSAKSDKYMGLKYQVDPNKMLMKPEEIEKYLPLDENGKKMNLASYMLENIIQEPLGFIIQEDDIKYEFVQDQEKSLNLLVTIPIKYFSNNSSITPIISLILESKAPVNMGQRPQGGGPQMGMSSGGGGGGGHGGGQAGGGGGHGGGGRPGGEGQAGPMQNKTLKDIKIEVKKLQLTSHE
ncbi:hypothetical protein HNS38_17325 [Lentimicrobium sp. L6]|uniref:hypothetical protein n=1 Tax=Lentimicrobium sp. L6 TaxID=2735916 RepID=UPI001555042F|nr:hypothetical protein [Lentimicrobium sp. L6]NPD86534.1 hypothetical protein [Lentimicrobium sp. L6]